MSTKSMARRVKNPREASVRRARRGRVRAVVQGLARMTVRLMPLALVGALGWSAFYGLGELETFDVRQVAVRNNEKAPAEEILARSGLKAGDNLFRISTSAIEEQVLGHPWVEKVAVFRRFPSTVVIEVSEYEPVLSVNVAGEPNVLYLLSRSGELFKEADAAEAATLPILSGLSRTDVEGKTSRMTRGIGNALSVLQLVSARGELDLEHLAEIEVSGPEAEIALLLSDPRGSDLYLALGLPPYGEKWQRLERVLGDLEQRNLRPSRIEFVSDGRVVVRTTSGTEAKI